MKSCSENEEGHLVLELKEHGSGKVRVTVKASDGQEDAILTFQIFVMEVNDRPYVSMTMHLIEVDEDSGAIKLQNFASMFTLLFGALSVLCFIGSCQ